MRSIFFSVSIFLRRYFVFGWLWYGLGDVIVELAHKITAGKADRGCSKKQTKRKSLREAKLYAHANTKSTFFRKDVKDAEKCEFIWNYLRIFVILHQNKCRKM